MTLEISVELSTVAACELAFDRQFSNHRSEHYNNIVSFFVSDPNGDVA